MNPVLKKLIVKDVRLEREGPVLYIRGPTCVPASTASAIVKIASGVPEGSSAVVMPKARFEAISQLCCDRMSRASLAVCLWVSMSPGMMVLPVASMRRAPAGIETLPLSPTAVMRPS